MPLLNGVAWDRSSSTAKCCAYQRAVLVAALLIALVALLAPLGALVAPPATRSHGSAIENMRLADGPEPVPICRGKVCPQLPLSTATVENIAALGLDGAGDIFVLSNEAASKGSLGAIR